MTNIKNYFKNAIIILFFSLTLLELTLNIIGWTYKDLRKNEFFSKNNYNKTISIITLGDSHTYGGNIKWNQTYSYLLWKKLNSTNKNINVNLVNAGVCEYNSYQVLYELDKNISKYKPNYAIILVGSSDFWNLINPYLESDFYIKNLNYEYQQRNSDEISKEHDGLIKKFKTYKFLKILFLNIKFKNAIDKIKIGLPKTDEKTTNYLTSKIFMEMLKKKQYSKIIDYSINMLETLNPESVYFSKSLSLFYAISVSYRNQSKYTAEDISNKLKNILSKRSDLKHKKLLIKYIRYFSELKAFENKAKINLKFNLLKIYFKLKSQNITPIFLTYPSEYKIANKIIRSVAKETNSYLIDFEFIFKKLNNNNIYTEYFDDDEHMNKKGHQIVAEEIFLFLNSKI